MPYTAPIGSAVEFVVDTDFPVAGNAVYFTLVETETRKFVPHLDLSLNLFSGTTNPLKINIPRLSVPVALYPSGAITGEYIPTLVINITMQPGITQYYHRRITVPVVSSSVNMIAPAYIPRYAYPPLLEITITNFFTPKFLPVIVPHIGLNEFLYASSFTSSIEVQSLSISMELYKTEFIGTLLSGIAIAGIPDSDGILSIEIPVAGENIISIPATTGSFIMSNGLNGSASIPIPSSSSESVITFRLRGEV